MELVSSCKDKLQHFRIRELKDVLTQLGLSKQGKKQDLVDRILAILADDQVSVIRVRKKAMGTVEVAKLVDDTYRKMQTPVGADLVTKPHIVVDSTPVKPKEEIDDSPQVEMKIRCLCGSSLLTESMIRCTDEKCQVLQHISCVIIPEMPTGGAPPVPPQFYCELCRLSRADPFLLTTTHPLCPVKLMITSIPTDGANPVQGVEKTFQITTQDKLLLSRAEYDVQAWSMLLNDNVPFRIQWPQHADLQVNGVAIRVTNRPGSQMLGANGRDDGAVISMYTREGVNKISLTGCDPRLFCLAVRMVKRRNLQQVRSMIPKESDGERFEDALTRVRRCLNGGGDTDNGDSDSDLEVVADSFTISLRCPVSGSRMKVAGRFRPCAHMGCFDLETFVEMQQKSRKWQCPICLKNYSLEHLIIDPYFNRITTMMRSCGEDTTDIEVKPDGSWRVRGDNEHWDFRRWHFPDGSATAPSEEVKPKLEASKAVKQEVDGLKIGIKKNSNGRWEVSKRDNMNTPSSEALQDYVISDDRQIIPMSSSTTASSREGEDKSINQDTKGNFNFAADTLESMHLNFDQTFSSSNYKAPAPDRDTDIIVLSDSDEENENTTLPFNSQVRVSGANFSMAPDGLPDAYQEDQTLGAAGGLNLFNSSADDFGMPPWPWPSVSQAGPSFQFLGSDPTASDGLVDFHQNHIGYPVSVDGYPLVSEPATNSTAVAPHTFDGHSNNDFNSLVDNPLAFGGEDPSLQIFLPTRPSESTAPTSVRHHQDSSGSIQCEDWVSLRLGDGSGRTMMTNGPNAGNRLRSEGTMQSLADAASLFLDGIRSDGSRRRPDNPISFPHQQRSVRPRLYLSIDSDSD